MTIYFKQPEPPVKHKVWDYTCGTKVAFIEDHSEPETMIAVRVVREIVETGTTSLPLWQQVAFA